MKSFFKAIQQNAKKYISLKLLPILLGLISGFSVFYFLYFFGAYGIQKGLSYSGHSHLFRSISFGVLTFAHFTIFETWLKPKWYSNGFKYQLIWYTVLVLLGSQFIYLLFNFFWNWQEWHLKSYLLIQKEFPLMMVLPLSFYFVLQSMLKPKHVEPSFFLFQSENGKDQLKIRLQDFLHANSAENYILIFYTSGGEIKQHLIRKPLKMLEQELKGHLEIVRCHRSHLVNKTNIRSIKQAKGKTFLEIGPESLPVSRQFQKEFLG